jgi:hypothetical protein
LGWERADVPKEATMHAVLVKVKLSDDPDPTILREQVVPRVKELPGFVAGYWVRDGEIGRSMVIFESEETARAASDRVPSMMPSGATIESNTVTEVVAHA